MRKLLLSAVLFGLIMLAGRHALAQKQAQRDALPNVPEAIRAPASETLVLHAHATGWQIYSCKAGQDGSFTWTLTGPEAELTDRAGKPIGRHLAGLAWLLDDGGEIRGKVAAQVDSPDSNSIPWLRLDVVTHSGKGVLAKVTTVQRVNTHGGKPPSENCDASHRDAIRKSTYTADYYFYAPAKAARN